MGRQPEIRRLVPPSGLKAAGRLSTDRRNRGARRSGRSSNGALPPSTCCRRVGNLNVEGEDRGLFAQHVWGTVRHRAQQRDRDLTLINLFRLPLAAVLLGSQSSGRLGVSTQRRAKRRKLAAVGSDDLSMELEKQGPFRR